MSNLAIKINLTKISGAHLLDLQGKSGVKKCIVLPVDDCNLFVGEKGVYLDLTGIEYKEQKFDDSHFIKQSISKEVYSTMTKEQQDAIPICGGVKPIAPKQIESNSQVDLQIVPVDENGLPF